jgi:voltage-gated potassium channel
MHQHKIAIFGYGNHGKFIAKGLKADGFEITIIESTKEHFKEAKSDHFEDVRLLDVTKDENLERIDVESYEQFVCVMDDEHLNVFLTLSLRSLFSDIYILAISDSLNVTKKLQMAGANKVIDLYEVSANKIYNILEKPIATKLLERFVGSKEGISFREMLIPKNSFLDGMMADDMDFSAEGVLLVGLIDEERGHHFEFITAGLEHKLDSGDTIVCIGYKEDLDSFETLITQKEQR